MTESVSYSVTPPEKLTSRCFSAPVSTQFPILLIFEIMASALLARADTAPAPASSTESIEGEEVVRSYKPIGELIKFAVNAG